MNSSRPMKWYASPLVSPARGLRVVYETEKVTSFISSRSRVTSVDFPDPDGAEIMKTVVFRGLITSSTLISFASSRSLNIERLFADAVNFGFCGQAQVCK